MVSYAHTIVGRAAADLPFLAGSPGYYRRYLYAPARNPVAPAGGADGLVIAVPGADPLLAGPPDSGTVNLVGRGFDGNSGFGYLFLEDQFPRRSDLGGGHHHVDDGWFLGLAGDAAGAVGWLG